MSAKEKAFLFETEKRLTACFTFLKKFFFFSLADEHIAYQDCVAIQIDKASLTITYGSKFLSRIKINGNRQYALEEGNFPSPELFSDTVNLAIHDLKATHAP